MPEISSDTIFEMDRRNRERLEALEKEQRAALKTFTEMHGTLISINGKLDGITESLKDQKEWRKDADERMTKHADDLNQAKGMGKVAVLVLTGGDLLYHLLSRVLR